MPIPERPRKVSRKSIEEIGAEWDVLARERHVQLIANEDVSFDHVLVPVVIGMLERAKVCRKSSVVDVGCGTGVLTEQLSHTYSRVVGIDPSKDSIRQALASTAGRARYVVSSVESYAQVGGQFDAIVANMSLMAMPDIYSGLASMAALCHGESTLVLTVTHPYFWPSYWGYANASWFSYSEEIFVEAEFKISRAASGRVTTHAHRPLAMYMEAVSKAGFLVAEMLEPEPEGVAVDLYPQRWEYPRFLAIRCVRYPT